MYKYIKGSKSPNYTDSNIIKKLEGEGFEVYVGMNNIAKQFSNSDEDQEMLQAIKDDHATVYLVLPTRARFWWFTDTSSLVSFFNSGNQLSMNQIGFVR